jgi:DNA-binding transcriptional MerR regulator
LKGFCIRGIRDLLEEEHDRANRVTSAGGSLLAGPLVPIGGLLAGAALGGLAGGSTGGYVQCKRRQHMDQNWEKELEDYVNRHPKG